MKCINCKNEELGVSCSESKDGFHAALSCEQCGMMYPVATYENEAICTPLAILKARKVIERFEKLERIEEKCHEPRMSEQTTKHRLKILPSFFEAVCDGIKTFEIRDNTDRGFQKGDDVELAEWDGEKFTGRNCVVIISYVTNFKQREGYVVFGFEKFYSHTY